MNLISLLCDKRQNVQNITIDVFKYLLVHRRAALEDLLVSRPNQGQQLDVLHGGFEFIIGDVYVGCFIRYFVLHFIACVNTHIAGCSNGFTWIFYSVNC